MDGKMSDAEWDAEWEAEKIAEEADRQRKSEAPPELTQDEFLAWRSPRLVDGNPTRLDNPLANRPQAGPFMGNPAGAVGSGQLVVREGKRLENTPTNPILKRWRRSIASIRV